jgi:hypothetical protein
MEELIDFLIDVFENVWRKFKINFFIILAGGLLSAGLLLPCVLKVFPLFSPACIAMRAALVLISFVFIKVYMLTIKEIKINSNTWKAVFTGLQNPLVFMIILTLIFGALSCVSGIPFIFPAYAEKSHFIVAAIVAAIAALALLPNALISLFYSYEGFSIKEAVSEGNKILDGNRGKMYFLTITLMLMALVLNLTYVGMVIVFPLVMMTMDQARQSLLKIAEEKKRKEESAKNKVYQPYRPKVDYTQDYAKEKPQAKKEEPQPQGAQKTGLGSVFGMSQQDAAETKPQETAAVPAGEGKREEPKSVKSGLGSVFKVAPEEKKDDAVQQKQAAEPAAEKAEIKNDKSAETPAPEQKNQETNTAENKNPKIVSAAEYESPVSQEEQMNLSDFIDLGISYESEDKMKKEEEEGGIDINAGEDVEVEIEIEKSEKEDFAKKEYKSGKAYIEEFGTISKKDSEVKAKPEPKKTSDAKSYLEEFGTIKRKK